MRVNASLREKIAGASATVEVGLGIIILLACIVSGVGMLVTTDIGVLFISPDYFQARLSDACLIIIGIELIKMITSYTIDSVVDVMLLAVARQMIVEHTAPFENLLAVIAVGLLFVIRKYLYISQIDKRKSKRETEEAIRAQVFDADMKKERETAG